MGLAASGIGLLSTIIAAPVTTGIQAGAVVCGLLCAGGKLISRKLQAKARKHNQIRVMSDSKLNTISDYISAALADDKISDEEFRLILSEVDKYNQMQEEIRSRQTQGIGLSETEKNELIRCRREEAMATSGTKLLQDLHPAGKTGKST